MAKSKNLTIDDLGAMVNGVAKSVDDLAAITKGEFEKASKERKELKRDMEEVKMKFAYTAWQIDVDELKKRMVAIEKKLGIKSPVI